VPIPTKSPGQTVVAPLGGETWNLGASGSSQRQSLAWQWIKGMQTPSVMTHVTSLMYYLPTKPAVTARYLRCRADERECLQVPRRRAGMPPGAARPSGNASRCRAAERECLRVPRGPARLRGGL
jgi:hypothetical protein